MGRENHPVRLTVVVILEVNIERQPEALVRSSLRVAVFGSNLVLFNPDLTKLSDHLSQHHYS